MSRKNKTTKPKAKLQPMYSQEQVNALVKSFATNGQEPEGLRKRLTSAMSGGYDNADTLHNIYLDYGYPETLDFSNYWNMYRRFGIAKNVVELKPDTCWITPPTIESSNPDFAREFDKLVKKQKFWVRQKGLDVRQRVGRYGGMFMRVRDNKAPDQPIDGKLSGLNGLVQMIPLYESQLKVLTTEQDPTKDNFDMPTMYQFSTSGAGNRDEKSMKSFNIHPDRLVIASEGADDGGIYGISALEAPYNSLMDMRKIMGGGGEGFYKNASKDIVFNLTDTASASANEELLKKFNDEYDDFTRNRSRRAMWTPGMEATTLDSNLVNPKEFLFNSLYDVAAAEKTPATIIIGQQTGRLASDEDSSQYLKMNQSRRKGYLTDVIERTIEWQIKWGILPAAEFEVVWDDLLASSDDEKLGNADKMATVNKTQFDSGQGPVFDPEEIREAAGFEAEAEDLPDPDETIPDDVIIEED
jgi:hypothetical protein